MKTFVATVSVLLMAAAFPWHASAQQPQREAQQSYISVSGTGEVKAAPDVAYVTLGVMTESRRAADAAAENATSAQRVIDAVKAQGIGAKDIQTSNFSVQPTYAPPGNVIRGYQVSNQVTATIHHGDAVGKVIDAAMTAGANSVQGVSFGLADRQAVEERALAEAIGAARRKAEAMARAADARIGPVLRIDATEQAPRPVFATAMAFAGAARVGAETPVETGQLTVSATVTVRYALVSGMANLTPSLRAAHGTRTAELEQQRDALVAQRAELARMYGPAHPQMVQLDKQIGGVRDAEIHELEEWRGEMTRKYTALHPLVAAITRQIEALRRP